MVVYVNEKVYLFSLTTIMSPTKRKISVRNKEYIQIINLNIKEKKEFKLAQQKRWTPPPRVVGGVAVGAGWVIGPAYGVAVALEPRAIAGSELGECASVRPGRQLFC